MAEQANQSQDFTPEEAAALKAIHQHVEALGVDDQGNPKAPTPEDQKAVQFIQAYKANTEPHYEGNILIPAKFKPIDLAQKKREAFSIDQAPALFGQAMNEVWQGAKKAPSDLYHAITDESKPVQNPTSMGESIARGAAQGPTLGAQPILSGAAEAGAGALESVVSGKNAFGNEGRLGGLANALSNYKRARDTQLSLNAHAQESNPKTYLASEFASAAPLAIATGGEALVNPGVSSSALPGFQAALNTAQISGLAGAVSGFSKSKGELSKGDFKQLAKDTADAGLTSASLGGLISSLASSGINPVSGLKEMAAKKATQATKPMDAFGLQIIKEGRDVPIGQTLLNEGIISNEAGIPSTRTTMLKKVEEKIKETGKAIGYYAEQADKAVARDSSLRGVSMEEFTNEVIKNVVNPLEQKGLTAEASNVTRYLNSLKKVHGNDDVSFSLAQEIKGALKDKAKFKNTSNTFLSDAYGDVYGILNGKIKSGVNEAFSKAAPELNNGFEKALSTDHDLFDARRLLQTSTAREANNNAVRPMDALFGSAGMITAAALSHGGASSILPVIGGATLGVGNHINRSIGNQVIATGLNGFANKIEQLGLGRIGRSPGPVLDQTIEFKEPSVITPRR